MFGTRTRSHASFTTCAELLQISMGRACALELTLSVDATNDGGEGRATIIIRDVATAGWLGGMRVLGRKVGEISLWRHLSSPYVCTAAQKI